MINSLLLIWPQNIEYWYIMFPTRTRNLNKPNRPGELGRAWWIIERSLIFFLLCVYPPGRSRKYVLSHFQIFEFLELFLMTSIQNLRPEIEFRNVRRVANSWDENRETALREAGTLVMNLINSEKKIMCSINEDSQNSYEIFFPLFYIMDIKKVIDVYEMLIWEPFIFNFQKLDMILQHLFLFYIKLW